MKRGILAFVALALIAVWHVPAMGQSGQERIKALEDKIQALEQEVQDIKATATGMKEEFQKKKVKPAFAFWKDDFFLSTADERFWMKIRGNLHFDTKFYGGNSANPTHFDVRRARFDFQGMWEEYLYFRCQAEFADSPYARNFWVDYKFRDWLHLRGGQMKPPFSTAWWTTDNNVNFLERMAGTPTYPYFDRGWWLWGDILDKTLTWNLSGFTGAGLELDYKKGDIDDHKDYIARLFYTPFKNDEGSALQGLNLCLQGSIGRQSVPTTRFEGGGYSAVVRDDKFWTWNTLATEIGSRDRWGAEIHYIYGPLSLSSEYLVTHWDEIDTIGGLTEDGEVTSWGTWVSYFLTGEKKQVSNFGWRQPKPKTNFDPVHLKGTGAWEVLARYTHTDTDDSLFDTGILTGADEVDEYTIGVCWTWNPMVRWQLNYVHLDGNRDGIQTGSSDSGGTGYVENEDMVGLRMIFKF